MYYILKIKIYAGDKDPKTGAVKLVYPDVYDPYLLERYGGTGNIGKDLAYPRDIEKGQDFEYLIVALPEDHAKIWAEHVDVSIIDSIEADTILENVRVKNNIPNERVFDKDRLDAIRLKQEMNKDLPANQRIPITQEDMDALNPDSDVPGINKTRKPVKDIRPDINDDITKLPGNLKQIQTDA